MSVLILQGPQASAMPPDACATPGWGGHDVHTIRCDHPGALVAGLRAARANDVALVVLDGGVLHLSDYARSWPALRAAIDQLPVPTSNCTTPAARNWSPGCIRGTCCWRRW